jgi:predicted nucleic acid-binding protein
LLDTNVLSEPTRPRPETRVLEWLEAVDEDRLFISVVSIAEIRRGVALLPHGLRRDRLAEWSSRDLPDRFAGRVLAIDLEVAERWGDLMAASQASGATLEPLDAFFAATALAFDLTLATRNVRDFHTCGVRLFNPWIAADAS